MTPVSLFAEPTINPNAYKFTLSCPLLEGETKSYSKPDEAEDSPVAKALFAVGGIDNISIHLNFVTVIKKQDKEWQTLLPKVEKAILESVGKP
ncbi:MAG: NifU N-terminal domain-containing protein [bacterium]